MTRTSASRITPWWAVGALRRYVSAYGLDALVDGAFFVLLGWTAGQSLGSTAAVSVIASSAVLKLATLVLVGGALSDRMGAATVARGTLLVRVVLLGSLSGLLAIDGPTAAGVLLTAAALYGLVDGLHDPAIEALSTEVPGAPTAQRSLQGALTTVREIGLLVAGPAVGGILLAASDAAAAAALAVVLAVAWVLVMSLGRPQPADSPDDPEGIPAVGLVSAARAGWSTVWANRRLRLMMLVFFVANLTLTPPVAAGTPLLARLHHWSSLEFGLVDAGYAVGALLGGLLISQTGDQISQPVRVALLSLVPTVAAIAAAGWFTQWWLAAVLFAVAGVSTGIGPSLLGGAIKEETPAGVQGRVQAVRAAAIVAGGPAGFAVFAATAALWSTPGALTSLAVLLGIVVLFALIRRPESPRA